MNAATRIVVQGSVFRGSLNRIILTKQIMLLMILMLSLLASAFVWIFVKDLERRLVNQLEITQQMHDRLQIEWGQLLLEQSTWATQSRIQQIAHDRLNMNEPTSQQVVLVAE